MNKIHKIYFLIGMPGVGKSYFGKKIAKLLNYKFLDLDNIIEKTHKMKIHEIFRIKGEHFFRENEEKILKEIVKNCNYNLVLATGGGTPMHNNLMRYMNKNGITVWFKTDIDFLIRNIKKQKKLRPLLNSEENLSVKLEKIYSTREETYAKSKLHIVINEGTKADLLTNWLLLSTIEE